jgi:cell division cycle 20, cofactor of APC complex
VKQEAGFRPYMPSLSSGSRNPSAKCYVSPFSCYLGKQGGRSMVCLTKFALFSTSPPVYVLHGDRFIPGRSAMDMDMAHYLLTEPRKDKENTAGMVASPSKEAYRRLLTGKLFNNRTRILDFRNKLPEPENMSSTNVASSNLQAEPTKQRRHIPEVRVIALLIPHLAILCNSVVACENGGSLMRLSQNMYSLPRGP